MLNLFLLRPGALGQNYTPWGMGLSFGIFVLAALTLRGRFRDYRPNGISRHIMVAWQLMTLYICYELALIVAFQRSNLEYFGRELATLAITLPVYGWFLSNRRFNQLFFSQFSGILGALGWSAAVTAALLFVNGSDFGSIHLFSIDIRGYEEVTDGEFSAGAIYFPLSMLYNKFTADSANIFRFSLFWREAGIAQAFSCFGLMYEAFTNRRRWVMLGCTFAAISAFSTIGLFVLAATFATIYLLRNRGNWPQKLFILPILLSVAFIALMYAPGIGLEDKITTHYTSFDDRSEGVTRAVDRLSNNPFGTGPYSVSDGGVSSGINLIAHAGSIGLVGAILQALLFSGWRFQVDRPSLQRIACCMPIFVTALVAQPLVGAPVAYIVAMCIIPAASVKGQAIVSWARNRPAKLISQA